MKLIDTTVALNKARIDSEGQIFSRKEMEHIVYGAGLPKHNSMFHQCKEFKVFNTLAPNQYTFGKKPIYKEKVFNAYQAYRQKVKKS